MSIYDLNWKQKVIELLPPDKRFTKFVAWLLNLVKPAEYNNNRIFFDYKIGAVYPNYAAGTYNKFDRVKYGQTIYESLQNSNTTAPPNALFWRVYQQNFIGVDERITYNHQKLTLEWALNKRFGTTFRQPPLISDIYINTNVIANPPFVVGGDEPISSTIYGVTGTEFIINSYTFLNFFNFTIYIPVAVWTALSADTAARDVIVRQFTDLYNTAGLTYNIITY